MKDKCGSDSPDHVCGEYDVSDLLEILDKSEINQWLIDNGLTTESEDGEKWAFTELGAAVAVLMLQRQAECLLGLLTMNGMPDEDAAQALHMMEGFQGSLIKALTSTGFLEEWVQKAVLKLKEDREKEATTDRDTPVRWVTLD